MARPKRQETILAILARKDKQTAQEILNNSKTVNEIKMGRGALFLGLDELKEEGIIKKDEKTKRYSIQSEIKNKTLHKLQNFNIEDIDPNDLVNGIKETGTPFEIGYVLLRSAMFNLSKLTLEQHSPGLTKFEKDKFERLIIHHNKVIKKTFEGLEEIDFNQTLALKKALDMGITIPQFELKMFAKANNKEIRKGIRIFKHK